MVNIHTPDLHMLRDDLISTMRRMLSQSVLKGEAITADWVKCYQAIQDSFYRLDKELKDDDDKGSFTPAYGWEEGGMES